MTDKNNFEERLLTELRQVAAERTEPSAEPAARRSAWKPRTFALGGGAAAVAVAAIAIVAGSGGSPSSAYAVEKNPDGEVSVKIESLKDAEGLEAKLAEVGVPADVNFAPAQTVVCAEPAKRLKNAKSVSMAPAISVKKSEGGAGIEIQKLERADVEGMKRVAPDAAGGRTEMSPVIEATAFTIDPEDIKEGEKLYVTTPSKAETAGVAAAIRTVETAPDC